jgi:hypothetical protein
MNSTQYKRKDARQSALEETVRKMGLENLTTEGAKQKIKSLHSVQVAILILFFNYSSTLFPVHFTFESSETTLRTLHLKLNL